MGGGAERATLRPADAGLRIAPTTTTLAESVRAAAVGHVEDALAAEELELTANEVARLEEPYVPV